VARTIFDEQTKTTARPNSRVRLNFKQLMVRIPLRKQLVTANFGKPIQV
jgi:hypothetical protein